MPTKRRPRKVVLGRYWFVQTSPGMLIALGDFKPVKDVLSTGQIVLGNYKPRHPDPPKKPRRRW